MLLLGGAGGNPRALTGDPQFMARLVTGAVTKPSNPDVCTAEYARFVLTFARVFGDPALPHPFFVTAVRARWRMR
ncbi:hypothetical protein Daura_47105 [Dactylosporangium aurantiacum]|uniref:Uncharacterized protein n=1 Tax=Dactylosporangium aurantiacum TaxID=35754 RepID=A0A9Q9IEM3_9ACTN|nr:hypothetical protein [Dactylosporangium aurantiacum]MDG6105490.1 hypothetical protein [Dactylosporangium aurantiacum]UWZ53976.1 hypothetical protein Daura_47105 [Dactylosporangium aurantiacum]